MEHDLTQFDRPDLVAEATKKTMTSVAKRAENWRVPLDQLQLLPGFNTREAADPEYQAHVRNLADLMIAETQREGAVPGRGWKDAHPAEVVVIGDKVYITGGAHRFAGAQLANSEVPGTVTDVLCVPKPAGTDMKELTIGLHTGNNGRKLSVVELSSVVARLKNQHSMTNTDIAKALAISPSYVAQLLTLSTAPQKLKDMVVKRQISGTLAIQKIDELGPNGAMELFTEATKPAAPKPQTNGGPPQDDPKGEDEEKPNTGNGEGQETPTRVTANTMKTNEQRAEAVMKRLATKLFPLVQQYMNDPTKPIDPAIGDKIDELLFVVEEARAPKEIQKKNKKAKT